MKLKLYNPFHCPDGRWGGVCTTIEEPKQPSKRKRCDKQVRFLFEVETDEGTRMAGRTFCANFSYGSELHIFLASWLGEDMPGFLDDDGEIDLDRLIGRKAELLITHGPHGAQYEYPVVNITGIYPEGTFAAE